MGLPRIREENETVVPDPGDDSRQDMNDVIVKHHVGEILSIAYLHWKQNGSRTDEQYLADAAFTMVRKLPPEIRLFRFSVDPFGFYFSYKDIERPFRMVVKFVNSRGAAIAVEYQSGEMTRSDVSIEPSDILPKGTFYGPGGHA